MTRFAIRSLCICVMIIIGMGTANAQLVTVRGDFFNITRSIHETADSLQFGCDSLVLRDSGKGLTNFQNKDSVVIMFVQNRFRIVNDMLNDSTFDYIRVRVREDNGVTLTRQDYDRVQTRGTARGHYRGIDKGVTGKEIGLRPVYRTAGNIAESSKFNSDRYSIRQELSFQLLNPTKGMDGIQIQNIWIKPNINNLASLAMPQDTTKDTLRAYLLDGSKIATGHVMSQCDLAIVRLMPGTTRILIWVNDSAQVIDAGEYIGSFGDYSRGRYFLGDDGLHKEESRTKYLRPRGANIHWGPDYGSPDEGMMIDGSPPEDTPLRKSPLFQTLAPYWYTIDFPHTYPQKRDHPCANPNPDHGLIPPYRIGEYSMADDPYQPAFVNSAVDTLRFFDEQGNRTWDVETTPVLQALAYNNGPPVDRTQYLRGITEEGDVLRQVGQVVYRRLSYVHAGDDGTTGDSIRIVATAKVHYTTPDNQAATLNALPDTTGGFPRMWPGRDISDIFTAASRRAVESHKDNSPRIALRWTIDPNREPVDPNSENVVAPLKSGYSIPHTGVKIVVRPNIPRKVIITPDFDSQSGRTLKFRIQVQDAFGNPVDDNERFKCELAPFAGANVAFLTTATFDTIPGMSLDSGRVSVHGDAPGTAVRFLHAPDGPEAVGAYRIRVRSSFAFPDGNKYAPSVHKPLRLDPFPLGNPPTLEGFIHTTIIPDGSPNNNFGVLFGPGMLGKCQALNSIDAGIGTKTGQTTAMGYVDVYWDGEKWLVYGE